MTIQKQPQSLSAPAEAAKASAHGQAARAALPMGTVVDAGCGAAAAAERLQRQQPLQDAETLALEGGSAPAAITLIQQHMLPWFTYGDSDSE